MANKKEAIEVLKESVSSEEQIKRLFAGMQNSISSINNLIDGCDRVKYQTVTISADEHVDLLMIEVNRRIESHKELKESSKELMESADKLIGKLESKVNKLNKIIELNEILRKGAHFHIDVMETKVKDLESRNLFERIFNL